MKTILLVFSLFFSWVSCSLAQSQWLERTLPALDEARAQDMAAYLIQQQRGHEILQLTALEQSFSGFLIAEQKGSAQGAVLILPDLAEHGHWPDITAPLRDSLPLDGWTTLSINLPDAPFVSTSQGRIQSQEPTNEEPASQEPNAEPLDTVPQATTEQTKENSTGPATSAEQTSAEQTSPDKAEPALPRLERLPDLAKPEPTIANDDSEVVDANAQYRQDMLARISAGFDYLTAKGQLNTVLVAQGQSARWAIQWLKDNQIGKNNKLKGMTLVLIDATSGSTTTVDINQPLSQFEFPILDLITNFNHNTEQVNSQRLGGMKHQQRELYQQIHITT
ncbi:MAG: DUF3530 family protein, partial [Venatoribacter sp.]